VRVVEVGAIADWVLADQYRAQLERWSREAGERGWWEEVMSAEAIDAEVARSGGTMSVVIEEFAVLDDGRRVLTEDRHGSCGIELMGAGLMRKRASRPVELPDLRPTVAMLEEDIRELVPGPRDAFDSRWNRLLTALAEQGLSVSVEELDSVPFSVEISPELRRHLRD
jgi:hypothetical protein